MSETVEREYDIWLTSFPEPVMLPEADYTFHRMGADCVIGVNHRDQLFRITRGDDYRLVVQSITPDDLDPITSMSIRHFPRKA